MGPGGFFPTNPDLADILGDMDFDFDNFIFWIFLGPKISGLGLAWARLGPTHLGPPTWAHRFGPRVSMLAIKHVDGNMFFGVIWCVLPFFGV